MGVLMEALRERTAEVDRLRARVNHSPTAVPPMGLIAALRSGVISERDLVLPQPDAPLPSASDGLLLRRKTKAGHALLLELLPLLLAHFSAVRYIACRPRLADRALVLRTGHLGWQAPPGPGPAAHNCLL